MPSCIFALVIGIDTYKSGDIWNLHSCVEDAKNIRSWLMNQLDVPKDQILLLDSQGTQRKIEDSLAEHFVNNSSIDYGDPILFYFAGHGSSLQAPTDWFESGSSVGNVQVLCPYDHSTKLAHGRVSGISDRSLRALIDDVASVKGNNITVILDCCFSPMQTTASARERHVTRWTRTSKATPEDLYRFLWTSARGKPNPSKLGVFKPDSFHILLAACPPDEKALEGREGGRFTANFLLATSNLSLHRTTYSQIIDHARLQVGGIQNFLCIGDHKNRFIFDDMPFAIDSGFSFASYDDETSLVKIELGSIHGIVEGSQLSLHLHNHRCSRSPPIATLVVVDVHPGWSFACLKFKSGIFEAPRSCWAKITQWNNCCPFRVYLKSTIASFTRMWKLKRTLANYDAVEKWTERFESHSS